MDNAIELNEVTFSYRPGIEILRIARLEMPTGERVLIHGPSGSGKSTLLGLLAGVLRADSGQVRMLGTDLSQLPSSRRDAFRGAHIGYIFQMFNLIPYLSVTENITLPCRLNRTRLSRLDGARIEDAAAEMADSLGIQDLAGTEVTELSVGQQQRVAAARALIGSPEIVIADEPTSALDTDHRERFLELLFTNCEKRRSNLVFVTHDRTLLPLFDRSIGLREINSAGKSAS